MSDILKIQAIDQVVDISAWQRDEESGKVFPEGSREKSLLRAPAEHIYDFILPGHRYLFKLSFNRYPEQFWIEIIAYKIGVLMGIEVPPAFVAVDEKEKKSGALIEWFLNYPGTVTEVKFSGAAYMQMLIKDYDLEKGTQHNFQSIKALHSLLRASRYKWNFNWLDYWTRALLFDTIIGNTDRHQDNWGIIWQYKDKVATPFRMTPIFDNGTSMGHEILRENFYKFSTKETMFKYISKGCHHMKWALSDNKKLNQFDFLKRLTNDYPETKNLITDLMKFDIGKVEDDIIELTKFKVSCPLSYDRAKFIISLLSYRKKVILSILNN